MRLKLVLGMSFLWSCLTGFSVAGLAAPQILGLVATTKPLPLSCTKGMCTVEVSGVCLQEHRPAPEAGTTYRVATGSKLTLIVQSRVGETRSMAVDNLVEIKSLRLFNSLSISLPERLVRDLSDDVVSAALSVAPMTSLLPLAGIDDPNPLSEREIRAYTGQLRALAESAFEVDKANLVATRILNRMVNSLPADTPVGAEGIASLGRTLSRASAAKIPSAARLIARAVDTCREKLRVERTPHLRACLSNQHDILNAKTTQNVWQSLRPSG